jgi:hypothetical protein
MKEESVKVLNMTILKIIAVLPVIITFLVVFVMLWTAKTNRVKLVGDIIERWIKAYKGTSK